MVRDPPDALTSTCWWCPGKNPDFWVVLKVQTQANIGWGLWVFGQSLSQHNQQQCSWLSEKDKQCLQHYWSISWFMSKPCLLHWSPEEFDGGWEEEMSGQVTPHRSVWSSVWSHSVAVVATLHTPLVASSCSPRWRSDWRGNDLTTERFRWNRIRCWTIYP